MEKKRMIKISRYYLMFMLVACTGASIWQLYLPQIGEAFTEVGAYLLAGNVKFRYGI